MTVPPARRRSTPAACAIVALSMLPLAAACSTSNPPAAPGDAGQPEAGPLGCSNPGEATPGPTDSHCQGVPTQPVSASSCYVDASGGDDASSGDDGGSGDACPYGLTMFGHEADDDDCKYHVVWSSTPLCEGAPGVTFTVTVTSKVDGSPVVAVPGGLIPEPFIPTTLDASCDTQSTHPSPNADNLVETPAGSGIYIGKVEFDAPGEWTIRFHIHEECADLRDDSPHGHAAFHLTVP